LPLRLPFQLNRPYCLQQKTAWSVHETEHPERYSVAKADLDIIRHEIRIGNTGNLFFPLAPPPTSKVNRDLTRKSPLSAHSRVFSTPPG
jgi:hypothetical protein